MPLWKYFADGGKRAVAVWHRRAGKDITALHRTMLQMLHRVGTYWHMLPLQNQARKVIWDGIVDGPDGPIKLIDWAFPQELRTATLAQEMKIRFANGSEWQLCGSDNYNALVGSNPVGIVMSEYSVAKPEAWEYIRPILAENGGWALFIYTPRGLNHGHDLYQHAENNPDWFSQILTVGDTLAIPTAAIEAERAAGMDEDMIRQEFFCSFQAAVRGAYYGKHLEEAEAQGRITSVPYDPACLVHTSWDIGIHDHTSIWFMQPIPGGEIHFIDYLEGTGEGVEYYLGELAKKPYNYGTDFVPHDFSARSYAAGRSPADIARGLNRKLHIIKAMNPQDRIQAARIMFPRCWFDKAKCQEGLNALKNYHKKWDTEKKCYLAHPEHDWASHPADSFGHFAVAYTDQIRPSPRIEPPRMFRPQPASSTGWMEN